MLESDPKQRIKAADVLKHSWFQIKTENMTNIYNEFFANLKRSINSQNIAIDLLVASV